MGNCGFGIVPSPPRIRDTIMKNLSVVEELLLQVGDAWRLNLEIKDYGVRLRRQHIGDTGKF